MSSEYYSKLLVSIRDKRRNKLESMLKEGYLYAEIVHFDNEKGIGVAIDDEGNKFVVHYKNMDRINYKVLSKNHRIHFKPGKFNNSIVALDVAIAY